MRRLFSVLLVLITLPLTAMAQDTRTVSGSVTYRERMALPENAVLMVEVLGADGTVQAEARLPTEGRQVPIPFTLELAGDVAGTLRAGLMVGPDLVWLGEPVALGAEMTGDLGELMLHRYEPMAFSSAFRCGAQMVQVGFVGEAMVMDTGGARMTLQSVPAASGALYEAAGDPETFFWSRGDAALVSIGGTQLPECKLSFPMQDTPYTASGNEPFWSVNVEGGQLTLRRLGMDDLTLPVTDTTLAEDGSIIVTAADPDRALRVVMVRRAGICRDTMTGMPHPETVDLSMGDNTITGCGGDPASLLMDRTWVVEDIGGAGVIDNSRVTLGFTPDGRVAGSGGCNRWFATYTLTGEGLSFSQPGTTMMACHDALMGQERGFFHALDAVIGFDIDDTGALLLRGPTSVMITARAATDGSAP
jgi:heat shock protein HslJ/membrane-bound inhibitor of C-type lysozyme